MIGAQYLQQKQVSARNPDGNVAMPQQKILLRVMPAFFGVISINFPAALVVYWVTSSVYRIGLQGYITRSLYAGEDSLGAQANQAAAKARAMKEKDGDKAKAGGKGDDGSKRPVDKPKAGGPAPRRATPARAGPTARLHRPSAAAPGQHRAGAASTNPRSKKKKRKRR